MAKVQGVAKVLATGLLRGNAWHVRLPEEVEDWDGKKHRHVIVSGITRADNPHLWDDETLVFPATPDGEVADFGEVWGRRGFADPARALLEMGYLYVM